MTLRKLFIAFALVLPLALTACDDHSSTNTVFAAGGSAPASQAATDEVIITFIDVGQGDSTLIRTTNSVMLIDGGERTAYETLLETLLYQNVFHIDYLVATHPHSDHIGGLVPLIRNDNGITFGAVIMPNVIHTTLTYENFLTAVLDNNIYAIEPYPGQIITLDDAVFTVIAPNSSGYSNLNNYSIMMIMDHGYNAFLFTGDAERISELETIAAFDDITAQVLAVGHHGSRTSSAPEFLDAVAPRYAVISAGQGNQHGHPHSVVLDLLAQRDVTTFITFETGHITMVSNGETITISTER